MDVTDINKGCRDSILYSLASKIMLLTYRLPWFIHSFIFRIRVRITV